MMREKSGYTVEYLQLAVHRHSVPCISPECDHAMNNGDLVVRDDETGYVYCSRTCWCVAHPVQSVVD